MFIYQTIALPFLVIVIWAVRVAQDTGRNSMLAVSLPGFAVIVVSHHVTAAMGLVVLVALAVVETVRADARGVVARVTLVFATGFSVCWVTVVAPEVIPYFQPVFAELFHSVLSFLGGEGQPDKAPAPITAPLVERLATMGSIGIVGLLVAWSTFVAARAGTRDPWTVPLVLGGLSLYGSVALRFVASDGAELFGRLSTFCYLPAAILGAGVLAAWSGAGPLTRAGAYPPPAGADGRRPSWAVAVFAMLSLVLSAGAVTGGWPPPYGRLPGPFLPGAYERSMDRQSFASARWVDRQLGAEERWAANFPNYTLLSTIGGQAVARTGTAMFQPAGADATAREFARSKDVNFVAIDLRDARALPASGSYFADDPGSHRYTEPYPLAGLTAIDRVRGVNRIYDSGDIRLYDVRGSDYDR